MTHHPDKAREAAAKKYREVHGNHSAAEWENLGAADIAYWRGRSDQIVDAFLAASLPADEKIAEIQVRSSCDIFIHDEHCSTDRAELLTLVTALSAKLKKATDEILSEQWKRGELLQEVDALKSQLTAQKAAHAKMLRDEADKLGDWPPLVSRHIRRLADKIEGGE